MDIYTYIWLGGIALFLVLEAITPSLIIIWFACGSLLAMISNLLNFGLWTQIFVFVLGSLVSFLVFYPVYKKKIQKKPTTTNAASLIGKKAVVVENIDTTHNLGRVKVAGLDWAAFTKHDTIIPSGTTVTIVKVEGVKLLVE